MSISVRFFLQKQEVTARFLAGKPEHAPYRLNCRAVAFKKPTVFAGCEKMNAKIELVSYNHSVGESNLHLQFTPKYRKKVFNDKDVRAECERSFQETAKRLNVQLAGMGFGPDHAHVFVASWKNHAICKLVQHLKGTSSRIIRQKYPVRLAIYELYEGLWSDGYFHRTVGAVTTEAMQRYITQSQQKHWKAEPSTPKQATILQYSGRQN
jgi:putative transposase